MQMRSWHFRSECTEQAEMCAHRLWNTYSRAESNAWRVSKNHWPAVADLSLKGFWGPGQWTEAGQVWGYRPWALQCCCCCWYKELEVEAGRTGWMQIGSLWGGVNVWSETKIITVRLVTVSLALPLSWGWCFPLLSPSASSSPTFAFLFLSQFSTIHYSMKHYTSLALNKNTLFFLQTFKHFL